MSMDGMPFGVPFAIDVDELPKLPPGNRLGTT